MRRGAARRGGWLVYPLLSLATLVTLAPFALAVRAPEDWEVVSNGRAVERDRGSWRFEPTPPISTYITAVVAGPYHVVRDSHDGIDLGVYCRQSLAQYLDADEVFEVTKAGFDFFHRVFEYRYPFGKYDQLFVPEFNAGAMENAGCVTIAEAYVFRSFDSAPGHAEQVPHSAFVNESCPASAPPRASVEVRVFAFYED